MVGNEANVSADQSQQGRKHDSFSQDAVSLSCGGCVCDSDRKSSINLISSPRCLQSLSSPTAPLNKSNHIGSDIEAAPVSLLSPSPASSLPNRLQHEDDTVALQLKYPGKLVVKVPYYEAGPLYVDLYSRPDGHGAFVKGFRRKPDGSVANAEAHGSIHVDDMLYSINDLVVTDLQFTAIIDSARKATFPLTLTFICSKYSDAEKYRRESMGSFASSIPSPRVSMTRWSSKLNQMIDSGVRSRSASIDRKSTHDSSPMGALDSPGMSGAAKFRQWQESNLERMRSSDGVKQLFRMIGRKNPEEDRETIAAILANLELEIDGDTHTSNIKLISSAPGRQTVDRLLENEFVMAWYRRTSSDDLIQIKGAVTSKYTPSADDIDTQISCQCQSIRFPHLSKLIETAPLKIDPTIRDTVNVLVEAGEGSFSATLASSELDTFQIRITADSVTLVKVSEEEDDCGIVASADYDQHVQILLDPTDSLRFCLKFREFGGILGARPGDKCDLRGHKQQRSPAFASSSSEATLKSLSCIVLLAPIREHRDIVARLIRYFRRSKLTEDQSKAAETEELSLFIDPSSNIDVFHTNAKDVVVDTTYTGPLGVGTPTNGQGAPLRNGSMSASSGSLALNVSASNNSLPGPILISTRVASQLSEETSTQMRKSEEQSLKDHLGDLIDEEITEDDDNASTDGDIQAAFVQERVNSQMRENAMLRQKITSLSVLLRTVENEKDEMLRAMEVKDERIAKQQVQLQQMTLALSQSNAQLELQFIELETLQNRVEEEIHEKELWLAQHHEATKMDASEHLELIELRRVTQQDQSRIQELESQVQQLQKEQHEHIQKQSTNESPAAGTEGQKEDVKRIVWLTKQVVEQEKQLEKSKEEYERLLVQRNGLESKASSLSNELNKLLRMSGSVEDLSRQLLERKRLATELSVTRAEAKRAADEVSEYKDALQCMMKQTGMGDKETHRILSQNLELQRTVNDLTDSLNASQRQITTLKSINSALAQQMQCAAIELSSPLSSSSSVMSRLDDFNDDDDDEDGEDVR